MTRPLEFVPTVLDPLVPAPPPPRHAVGATLREALTHVFYDGRRIRAVLLIGLLLTALATWLAPKRYVAEASLLLRLGREYIYTPEVGDAAPGAPVAYDREQTLQAEARILTSRDTLEAALAQLGVAAVYPRLAAQGLDPAAQRAKALLAMDKALETAEKELRDEISRIEKDETLDDRSREVQVSQKEQQLNRQLEVRKEQLERDVNSRVRRSAVEMKREVRRVENTVRIVACIVPAILPICFGMLFLGMRNLAEQQSINPNRRKS